MPKEEEKKGNLILGYLNWKIKICKNNKPLQGIAPPICLS